MSRGVLVTGGGTGIGWSISRAFADAGDRVVIGQSTARKARTAAARLGRRGAQAWGVGADLATAAGCRELVSEAVGHLGALDVVVNNAAVAGSNALGKLESFDDERLDQIVDLNLKAPFRLSRDAIVSMPRGGVIVNIGSVGGFAAQEHAAAYCASKGGLEALTRSLAIDLAGRGIRVVGVAPGDIATSGARRADRVRGRALPMRYTRLNPLGRRGRGVDVAAAVLFLSSREASFVTGTTLVVDGGRLAY